MATPRHVVLNLGMPRSGTTLVQKMFEQGTGYFHQKVCEYHPWHPMNSSGLIRLVNTFRHKEVTLLRTTRDVEEVVDSVRVGREMGNPHNWTDDEVRELHDTEHRHWRGFLTVLPHALDPSIHCSTHVIDYSDLGTDVRQVVLREVAKEIPPSASNLLAWERYLERTWMIRPVNVGRLMRAQR